VFVAVYIMSHPPSAPAGAPAGGSSIVYVTSSASELGNPISPSSDESASAIERPSGAARADHTRRSKPAGPPCSVSSSPVADECSLHGRVYVVPASVKEQFAIRFATRPMSAPK